MGMKVMLGGKIHRAGITEAPLHYAGSITIDGRLMKKAGIQPYERVQVVNVNNGSRIETYVIEGEADSGVICLNGAAARCGQVGDQVIIMSYVWLDEKECGEHKPKIVIVGLDNRIAER